MSRTHLLSARQVFLLVSTLFICTIGKAQTFGTELFSTFDHVPREQISDVNGDPIETPEGPTGPVGAPTDPLPTVKVPLARGIYRTIDGTFNNLSFLEWGASDIPFRRGAPAAYGPPDLLNDLAGPNRVSPRAISNLLNKQEASTPNKNKLSSFVFTWGQFIDHDIDLSGEGHTELAPIALPADEPTFTQPIRFTRSAVFPGTGIKSPREQVNLITSWIDASNVYGSEHTRAKWLRTYRDGKLKMASNQLLPYNTIDGEKKSPIDPTAPSMASIPGAVPTHFVAGDVRANEQPGLTTLHTLFVREHNRYCDELIKRGITKDEVIYQTARQWVGGLLQHITFTQFLPAMGIRLDPYKGYQPSTQPDIANIFANAAYRIGHTMVTNELLLLNEKCKAIDANNSLVGNFFNNAIIQDFGIEPICRGLSAQIQEEIDLKVVDGLRDFLFQIPGAPPAGLDLASLNIQRGRDHGLADYNTVREKFLGKKVTKFSQITRNEKLQHLLSKAYGGDLHDIDPWIGLLAEDHARGSSVGPTMLAIIKDQFQRLRDSDFYYYENDPAISASVKKAIKNTLLADIITRNSSFKAPKNVFKVEDCKPPIKDVCEQVTFKITGNSVAINNIKAPVIVIKIFNIAAKKGARPVFRYSGTTKRKLIVHHLPKGRYKAVFSLYNNRWKKICGPTSKEFTIEGTPGGPTLCDQIKVIGDNKRIIVKNLAAPFSKIKVFKLDRHGKYIHPEVCTYIVRDKKSFIIPNLDAGKYAVLVSLFNKRWASLCKAKKFIVSVSRKNLRESATSRSEQKVSKLPQQELTVFPNPAVEEAVINLSTFAGTATELRVINHLGKTVYMENSSLLTDSYRAIDTSTWSSGMYFVTVRRADGTWVSKKLVVKRR